MNIGEIFSTFRKERGITLKEATGNQFSTSMLSRFEKILSIIMCKHSSRVEEC